MTTEYVWVPREPTAEMLRAAVECRHGSATYRCVSNEGLADYESEAADDYAAMLAEAPALSAVNDASEIESLRAQLAAAEAERDEQCKLLAAGMEREQIFQLRAERAEAERDRAVEDAERLRIDAALASAAGEAASG